MPATGICSASPLPWPWPVLRNPSRGAHMGWARARGGRRCDASGRRARRCPGRRDEARDSGRGLASAAPAVTNLSGAPGLGGEGSWSVLNTPSAPIACAYTSPSATSRPISLVSPPHCPHRRPCHSPPSLHVPLSVPRAAPPLFSRLGYLYGVIARTLALQPHI